MARISNPRILKRRCKINSMPRVFPLSQRHILRDLIQPWNNSNGIVSDIIWDKSWLTIFTSSTNKSRYTVVNDHKLPTGRDTMVNLMIFNIAETDTSWLDSESKLNMVGINWKCKLKTNTSACRLDSYVISTATPYFWCPATWWDYYNYCVMLGDLLNQWLPLLTGVETLCHISACKLDSN